MNQETIARVILVVGCTLAKKYPPSSVEMTEGGVDENIYSYSGSYSEQGFDLRENPGGEVAEVESGIEGGEFNIRYGSTNVATLSITGSSGNAKDIYNTKNYYSINFTGSSIRLDGISFRVS